jgi:hypothetical protein
MTKDEIANSVTLMLIDDHQGDTPPGIFAPLCELVHDLQSRYEHFAPIFGLQEVDTGFQVVFYVHLARALSAERSKGNLPSENIEYYRELYLASLISTNLFLTDATPKYSDWAIIDVKDMSEDETNRISKSDSADEQAAILTKTSKIREIAQSQLERLDNETAVNKKHIHEHLPRPLQDYLSKLIRTNCQASITHLPENPEEHSVLIKYYIELAWRADDVIDLTKFLLQSILKKIELGYYEDAHILTIFIDHLRPSDIEASDESTERQHEKDLSELLSKINTTLLHASQKSRDASFPLSFLCDIFSKLIGILDDEPNKSEEENSTKSSLASQSI